MSDTSLVRLGDLIEGIAAGVSLQGENRRPRVDEVGILTLSALGSGNLDLTACKAVSAALVPKLGPHVRAGTILMSRSNTPELVGSCVYAETNSTDRFLPDLIWEIQLRSDAPCGAKWLAAYLRTAPGRRILLRAAAGSSGSMIKLSMDRLRNLAIPIPPREVQEAIVRTGGCLDRLAMCVDSLAEAKRSFKNGLRRQLLTRQRSFKGFEHCQWRAVTLGELVSYVPRRMPKPSGQFLSAGIRSHGKGVFLKREFQSSAIALEELFELKAKDLVVNITFGWEGAIAIVPHEADGALVSHRFPTYEVDESKVLVEYLRHIISSKRFVFDVAVASPGGAGRNRVLNRHDFLDIALTIPCIDEQHLISQVLNTCEMEIELLAAQRRQVDAYKRALLHGLLSGEVGVPS